MGKVLQSGITMAAENGHHVWAIVLRLMTAWLYEEGGDFVRAQELSEQELAHARTARHGYSLFLGALSSGRASLGLAKNEHAFAHFTWVSRRLEPLLQDWMLRFPLSRSWSEYWLTCGEPEKARQEAYQLCTLAGQCGERTYEALGRRVLALAAVSEGRWREAETEISQAMTTLDRVAAPLAEWRVYATAAHIAEHQRRKAHARKRWEQSKAVIFSLVDSLDQDNPLRQIFLAHPTVQDVLQHA